jgi:hypothetical protein
MPSFLPAATVPGRSQWFLVQKDRWILRAGRFRIHRLFHEELVKGRKRPVAKVRQTPAAGGVRWRGGDLGRLVG